MAYRPESPFSPASAARRLGLLVLALLLCPPVPAQLYRWVDENGKVHYSDTVPPAANERPRVKMRPDGIVVERADRALSAEERRALAARSEETARERAEQEARARRDRALLDRYTSLDEFDQVARRRLQDADEVLRSLAAREPALTQRIHALLALNLRPGSRELFELRSLANEAQLLSEQLLTRVAAREALVQTIADERSRLSALLAQQGARPPSAPATAVPPATAPASPGAMKK